MAVETATVPQYAVLSTNGELLLSSEMQESLGLHPGSRVAMSIQQGRLVLEPAADDLLEELQRTFAGGPSLEDELYAMRREEREHEARKSGC
ncbi:hypothetical protein [Granulicella tundricola]|uniref:hypothetical protein n=1 Tax=Granulicella tundricola TaxID=940615 RepID=UPI0005A0377A|nr:hypothetical protein [Granulicella tundricola]